MLKRTPNNPVRIGYTAVPHYKPFVKTHGSPILDLVFIQLVLLCRYSAKRVPAYFTQSVTRLHVIVVKVHVHDTDGVIHTPETIFSFGV